MSYRVELLAFRSLLLLLGSALSSVARADNPHVENRCPKLSSEQYEELDARVQLLLKAEASGRAAPSVVCTEEAAWVEWEGERLAIVGARAIADEVVDLVEAHLHGSGADAEGQPPAAVSAPAESTLQPGTGTAPPLPATSRPADRRATRASDARGGGILVALETEVPAESFGWALGPAFDFGASAGPLILGGREAFRATLSGRQVLFMDFEGSVSYGAPLDPNALLGAVVRFGAEWMVAYPQGNAGQAAVAPEVDFGLRLAHSVGWFGLWFGADARYRLAPLSLHARERLVANDLGFSLSLGAAFVDWSRR